MKLLCALFFTLCIWFANAHYYAKTWWPGNVGTRGLPTVLEWEPSTKRLFIAFKATTPGMKHSIYTWIPGRDPKLFHEFEDSVLSAGSGPLGIAFSPRYAKSRMVYVYLTDRNVTNAMGKNQVVRLKENKAGMGINLKVLFTSNVATNPANNGGLFISYKGGLLLGLGDANKPAWAQNATYNSGKLLRLKWNGACVEKNCMPTTWGNRNPYRAARDGEGKIWFHDLGPNCNDELNMLVEGSNYGWGNKSWAGGCATIADTNQDGTNVVLPKYWTKDRRSPTGLAIGKNFFGMKWPQETALAGHFIGQYISAINLKANPITGQIIWNGTRSILDLEATPAGRVFYSDVSGSVSELLYNKTK